jgi:17beta-estradiol 17-dehydrogenase / very-long-chain 3-oxoacyl-CoA reductase
MTASPDVKVVSHAMDFGQDKQEDYNALQKILAGLESIAILINNVGLSHSIPVEFVETPPHEMEQIIIINCLATLKVTQMVLPHMLLHKAGLILTMGSFGGLAPTPLLATYSGSKAFLQQWSTALASEVASQGITVHLVQSYLVTSSMSKVRRSNWQVPSEKQFVKSVLSKIGRRGGSIGYMYTGSPWWSHALIASAMIGVLGTMNGTLLEFNRKMQVSMRKRALAKAERERAKEKKAS